jgi:hypothetical protein
MKKERRKLLSIMRRDIWDNPRLYDFWELSSNKLKYMLEHKSKKDRRMEPAIVPLLEQRGHLK